MADWLSAMNRDAAAIAFPDVELRDDDVISVEMDNDPGYCYSSYTYEDPSFNINVWVRRDDPMDTLFREYRGEDAAAFWIELMERGTNAQP